MKIIAAGLAALVITVSPLAQPLAHASSGGYSGGAKYGPLPGQVYGHRHGHRRASGAGHGVYAASLPAASLPNEAGAPNGGFFVNGIFYPHGTPPNIWMK
jgi:hypothetical protein